MSSDELITPDQSLVIAQDSICTPDKLLDHAVSQSPKKSPKVTPLPPVSHNSLNISKRRKLEPSTPDTATDSSTTSASSSHHLKPFITPCKNRSFSSPLLHSKRTPSLQDQPIPVLSPPSPANSIRSVSSSSIINPSLLNTPSQEKTLDKADLISLPGSATSSTSSASSQIVLNPDDKITSSTPSLTSKATANTPTTYHRTSPLSSRSTDPTLTELLKKEREIDREISKMNKNVDTARLALKYKRSSEDEEKLQKLAIQWRDVAQKAASYLYNEASLYIDRIGGMEEYLRRKKEDEETRKQFENNNSIDVDELTPEQKEQYEVLRAEYEEQSTYDTNAKTSEEDEANSKEFTMKYMLKSLNVDYKKVFPEDKTE